MAEQVNVRPETKAMLQLVAAREGRTMMDVVHDAVCMYTGQERARLIVRGFVEYLEPEMKRAAERLVSHLEAEERKQVLLEQRALRMEGSDLEAIDFEQLEKLKEDVEES